MVNGPATAAEPDQAPAHPVRDTRFNPGKRARELSRQGVQARRKLAAHRVRDLVDAVETVEDAKRWAKQAFVWIATGKVSQGNAAIGAIRIWRELHELGATYEAVNELRKSLVAVSQERDRMRRELEQLRPARPASAA